MAVPRDQCHSLGNGYSFSPFGPGVRKGVLRRNLKRAKGIPISQRMTSIVRHSHRGLIITSYGTILTCRDFHSDGGAENKFWIFFPPKKPKMFVGRWCTGLL